MTRNLTQRLVPPGLFLVVLAAAALPPAGSGRSLASVIRVPQDVATLQLAVAAAGPGDTILLDRGLYPGGVTVPATKHDLTIRGVDRNAVILDGADRRKNGIVVHADGVSILNMSAHNFLENGFYWDGANRFRASYLTAWNIRGYGIYIEHGRIGVIDHDFVSGAADAAYYVGECRPCDTTITDVVAERSAVGYSGTNSSQVTIRNSRWIANGAGIVPNTYANEALPPEARTTISGNTILDSGRRRVPISTPLAGFVGIGVAVAGGNENLVHDNRIENSERYGIAIFSTARYVTFDPALARDPGPPWRPHDNRILRNLVRSSGWADLALAAGSGPRNCFSGNTVQTTAPARLQIANCAAGAAAGDARVAQVLTARVRKMFHETIRRRRPPPYTAGEAAPPQSNIPD